MTGPRRCIAKAVQESMGDSDAGQEPPGFPGWFSAELRPQLDWLRSFGTIEREVAGRSPFEAPFYAIGGALGSG